jgi:hypothetical protein
MKIGFRCHCCWYYPKKSNLLVQDPQMFSVYKKIKTTDPHNNILRLKKEKEKMEKFRNLCLAQPQLVRDCCVYNFQFFM